MSPHKDPARKRRIRSKVARLRRRSVPLAAADDQASPPVEAPPPAEPGPTPTARPPFAEPGGTAAEPPPLPVRGAAPAPGSAQDGAPGSRVEPPPFPPLSLLSAEELLADQPSLDMLRRVRRGLWALPESDRHLSD